MKRSRLQIYLVRSISLVVLSMLLCACSEKEGAWKDNVKLSQDEAVFSGEGDSIRITSNGSDDWWISTVSLDDNYIDIDSINTLLDQFSIIDEAFLIVKRNQREMDIMMSSNPNDSPRLLLIGIQSGNFFDGIKITQLNK